MEKLFMYIKIIALTIVFLLSSFSVQLQAEEINVSSISELQSAINIASAGDIIILADGTYNNNNFNVSTSNITVRAETPGGVYLNGSNDITISGDYITFSGFQFTSGSISGLVISVDGSHNTLTQLNFNGYSAQKYINLQDGSQYNEVTYCNFENKPTSAAKGNLIHIAAHNSIVGYHKIRYCSFQNMPGNGGDYGNECIRLSNGEQSTYIARTVVEYCYFKDTGLGDSEAISVKCRENTLRYNTFKNNPDAMMVFRNGNDNIGYGNFFIGSGGIRVKEANNIYCYNNYFENAGVGGTMDAVTYVYVDPNLKNINFIHNTFVECGMIDLDNGASNNTWANNVFKKSSGDIFMGSPSGISWAGNIYQGTLGISIPSGMTNINPQLELNSDGYYGLSSSSPAIDAASSSYPAIMDISGVDDDPSLLLDISGQSRPTTVILKDVGCDEYTSGGITNRPLTLSDVGPSYLGGPGDKLDQTITFAPLPEKTVGDPDFSPGATASSGLTVSYTSSNTAVATIVSGNIHIVGAGTSTIIASQAGDATYNPAPDVPQVLTVISGEKQDQTITFDPLPEKVYGDADFNPGATASSGLPVSYSSSNTAVATIVSGNIHIGGAGTSVITASQAGDANYNPAPDVQQTLTVVKANQTITFDPLPSKVVGDPDFSPGATASSGLPVSYTSSNTAVATIVSGNIHIVGAGTSVITASQAGDANYNAAADVPQTLTVTAEPVVSYYVPSATTILTGALKSGSYSNLSSNDESYYIVNSTTSGTIETDWYGSVTISQAPSSAAKLTINYDGKNSRSNTQVLYLYNWTTTSWNQIDSRTVGNSDVLITNVQTSPADFISVTGEIRLRVYSSGATKKYTASGDWMQFVVETSLAKQIVFAGDAEDEDQLLADEIAQPKESRLVSNYPNPFNPSTTLRYEIIDNANVQITVYNVGGAKVQELVNDMKAAGVYDVRFNATSLASGTYFVRFVATPLNGMRSIVNTRKIVLMK